MDAVRDHEVRVTLRLARDGALEIAEFFSSLEVAGIDDADLGEDEVLEHAGEHPLDAHYGVNSEAIEAVDEDHSRLCLRIANRCGALFGIVSDAEGFDQLIEPSELLAGMVVVPLDQKRDGDQGAGDEDGDPASFVELDDAE